METRIREIPILFSTPMVQAILDGCKTMTRRVVKPQPKPGKSINPCGWCESGWSTWTGNGCDCSNIPCPYGKTGDRLWVRETWNENPAHELNKNYKGLPPKEQFAIYKASSPDFSGGWKPSIFMPKEAARIWLEVVNVRVERLQEITEEDAKKEGIHEPYIASETGYETEMRGQFRDLWDSINLKRGYGWDTSPWVWVVEFRRVER